jgi:protein STE50
MAAYKVTGYREDSDADDEYERDSVFMSPTIPQDGYSASPTDSDAQSTEPTPTTYTHSKDAISPRGLMSEWSAEQSADFVIGLGLGQYADTFVGMFG